MSEKPLKTAMTICDVNSTLLTYKSAGSMELNSCIPKDELVIETPNGLALVSSQYKLLFRTPATKLPSVP